MENMDYREIIKKIEKDVLSRLDKVNNYTHLDYELIAMSIIENIEDEKLRKNLLNKFSNKANILYYENRRRMKISSLEDFIGEEIGDIEDTEIDEDIDEIDMYLTEEEEEEWRRIMGDE